MFPPRRKSRSAARPQQEIELDPVAIALVIWLTMMVLTAIVMRAKPQETTPPSAGLDIPITYMSLM